MTTLRMWQVDAFARRPFAGNPACVVPLERWLDDDTLQAIAAENNVSETAFVVPEGREYDIRWFTPAAEVDLCGHATLASAYVVLTHLEPARDRVTFGSKSGPLSVTRDRDGGRLTMDFPEIACAPAETSDALVRALNGARPSETWLGERLMAVFENEAQVRALAPDFGRVLELPGVGLIATAPGEGCDFVSRFFDPQVGVNEDPVTGSTHCQLVPWWAKRLGRSVLTARQVSKRGGELWLEHVPPRVRISGDAVEFMSATIQV